ncbi:MULTISPECIES: hypothetical protein [unclassified Archaeoglobus]|jgi:pyruvate-formate lyase-activating enzyme|uniref:hypothetical protein n=1 Tax=unclassified Archaeoglobus TaxID=2643606 RepID=UPI0025B8C7D3|nr:MULTISPECIES: hypothetical protein [unclassified Archaeoglobus]
MKIVIEFDENEIKKLLELLAHRDDEIKEKSSDLIDNLKPENLPRKIAEKLERLESIARLESNEAIGKAPRWDEAIR